jgi:hypothetical protein
VDRVFPLEVDSIFPTQTDPDTVEDVPSAPRIRRRILEDETKYSGKVGVFTSCVTNAHCAPSFYNPTICESLWTLPTPCYSCSERVHGNSFSLGYRCNAESKMCECSPPVSVDSEDASDASDEIDWRGNSWCDKIMRGYRHAHVRSPLENMWVQKCGRLREFGIGMTNWLGLQSIPPDIVYNPERALAIIMDVVQGVGIYFREGYSGADEDEDAAALEMFFDRLVQARVDPVLTFRVLDAGQKIMGTGRAIMAEFSLLDTIGSTLDTVAPEASIKFRLGINATTEAATTFINAASRMSIADTLETFEITVNSLQKFAALAKNVSAHVASNVTVANNVVVADNETIVNNITVVSNDTALSFLSAAEASSRARALLFTIQECEILTNAKSRLVTAMNSLAEYYEGEDTYIGASLCFYEMFLKGASGDECPAAVPFPPKMPVAVNTGPFRSISVSDLTPIRIAGYVDEWLSKPKEELFRKIINATKKKKTLLSTFSRREGRINCRVARIESCFPGNLPFSLSVPAAPRNSR